MQHPQHAASSLQPLDGGVAAVDLLMQVDVLQVKIVARMLHPRRHPSKLFMQAAIHVRSPPPWNCAALHGCAPTWPRVGDPPGAVPPPR